MGFSGYSELMSVAETIFNHNMLQVFNSGGNDTLLGLALRRWLLVMVQQLLDGECAAVDLLEVLDLGLDGS